MASRRWRQWPSRIKDEANATNGVVGLLGGAAVAAGAFLSAPIATIMGGVVVAGAIGWCAWKGFPPKMKYASELVGATLSVLDVEAIDPPINKVGFVGASRVGKTTLLSHIAFRQTSNTRTERLYATIIGSPTAPLKYFALLDGAGQQFTQQFKILDAANILLIFVDHNIGDADVSLDANRLSEHKHFLNQLRNHLVSNRHLIHHIYFVLNKSDLWTQGVDATNIRTWFNNLVDEWNMRELPPSTRVEHTNSRPSDVTNLVNKLFRHAS